MAPWGLMRNADVLEVFAEYACPADAEPLPSPAAAFLRWCTQHRLTTATLTAGVLEHVTARGIFANVERFTFESGQRVAALEADTHGAWCWRTCFASSGRS